MTYLRPPKCPIIDVSLRCHTNSQFSVLSRSRASAFTRRCNPTCGFCPLLRIQVSFFAASIWTILKFRRTSSNVARVSYATSLMRQSVLHLHHRASARGALLLRHRQRVRRARRPGAPDPRRLVQAFHRHARAGRDAPPAPPAALHPRAEAARIFRRRPPHRHLSGRRVSRALLRGLPSPRGRPAGSRDDRGSRVLQPRAGSGPHVSLS